MKYFVVTHIDPPWEIPFKHEKVGLEGYVPPGDSGLSASNLISKALDYETALGALRAIPAINYSIESAEDDEIVFVGTYRLFLGSEMADNWLDYSVQENKIVHPNELGDLGRNLIQMGVPDGVDILINAPRILPDTILGQYSRVHHLDDLLFAVGVAIRAGLLDPLLVPKFLSSNTLIPYGLYATKKKLRLEINEKIWWCVMQFYKDHYTPRSAYQRRVIDFAFERVLSMVLLQRIIRDGLRCKACRNIWVSQDGVYRQSV